MSDRREFSNNFPDYIGQTLLNDHGQIRNSYSKKLYAQIQQMLCDLYDALEVETDSDDYSVYTGTSGIALLHFHMYNVIDHCRKDRYLKRALFYLDEPLESLKARKYTFLCGDAGPLALAAVIYHKLGRKEDAEECIKRLISIHKTVIEQEDMPDELLFGRAGYLYALIFVQKHIGDQAFDNDVFDKVYKKIIESGQYRSMKEKSRCPLMYVWHDKKYLGAAHGLAGILYVLMLADKPEYKQTLMEQVKPSIDFLMTLRFPSGNYPSSIGSASGDKLVHWCHGAPGWIHMFIKAYQVFDDKNYLAEAKSCAEVIWSRGLLRKGYGLCHGVTGNAYGFLALYKATLEPMYLYRAWKFGEWCFDYGKHGCRTPDRPYSLFEGMAGTIYFLADLIDPSKAKFPAFDI